MATSKLPVTFKGAPLPVGFVGTPQQIEDAIVARLSIESEEDFALFVTGDTAPTSNVGPWLRGGIAWYVWDNVTGAYIPIPVIPRYPFRGDMTADQDQVFGGASTISTDIVFTEILDPNTVFGGSVFSAPIDGIYQLNASIRVSSVGTTAPSSITVGFKKNGVALGSDVVVGTGVSTYVLNTLVQLVAGDGIVVNTTTTATAAGTLKNNKTGSYFCGNRVQ